MSDIDIAAVGSLKVLDPKRPIREADIGQRHGLQGRMAMGGVSAPGAGGTAAAVVNSQPSPHRVCEIAVRASRWKSQKAQTMPRLG